MNDKFKGYGYLLLFILSVVNIIFYIKSTIEIELYRWCLTTLFGLFFLKSGIEKLKK